VDVPPCSSGIIPVPDADPDDPQHRGRPPRTGGLPARSPRHRQADAFDAHVQGEQRKVDEGPAEAFTMAG
jgi:hypothetical protein